MIQCDEQRDKKSITKFTKEKALNEMELIDTAKILHSAVILDHSAKWTYLPLMVIKACSRDRRLVEV